MPLSVNCEWCKKPFIAKRKSAKYCSDACRVANHRYTPGQDLRVSCKSAKMHLESALNLLERSPEIIVELDSEFMALRNWLDEKIRENYHKVLNEERSRLL